MQIKPFLRWAGGKNWFVSRYRSNFVSPDFLNYHEPFLGGGSFFFSLECEGTPYLSDANAELIETYISVRDSCEAVISHLAKYENSEEQYYQIRSSNPDTQPEKAARFIYLNQTSFNGIYRVNRKGQYNVPYGFRSKNFLDPQNLRLASKKLKGTVLTVADFETSLKRAKPRDLVFIDPPYTVSHNKNGFIKYNAALFSLDDQYRLAKCIERLKEVGAFYILTNAAHEKIEEIFDLGDRKLEMSRANLIGGALAKRGQTTEFVFTNLQVS